MRIRSALAFVVSTFLIPGGAQAGSDYKDLFQLSLDQLAELKVEDVITKAAKWEAHSKDLPFSIQIIEPKSYYSPLQNSLQDIDHSSTSLIVSEYNNVTPQLYIRAIGSNSSGAGDDPSVALLHNGSNISRPGFHNLLLFDMQRIEVIKGAQGSLYGKGVIGGAVNLVTRSPDHENSFIYMSATGKDSGWEANGVHNHHFGSSAANRLSIAANYTDGYVRNHGTDNDLGGADQFALREQFSWENESEKLSFLLEYQTLESESPAHSYQGDTPINPFPATLTPYRDDELDVSTPIDPETELDFYLTSLNYEMESSLGRWVSITMLNKGDYDFNLLILPINFMPTTNFAEEEAWQASQELRLEKVNEAFSWNAGIYLSKERVKRNEGADFVGLINLLGFGAALTPDTPGITYYDATTDVINKAAFAHSEWHFNPKWYLTLGFRSDHITKDFELETVGGDPLNITLTNSQDFSMKTDRSWSENSYTVALSYSPSENNTLYGRIGTGFKAGNFNNLAASEQSAFAASKPEKAVSSEIGMKGFYFDQTVLLNMAVFDIDYKNLQVFIGLESEFNAPKADIRGFEWEIQAKMDRGISLTANYTYLDARFHNFVSPDGVQLKGKHLPRAPRNSFALAFDYAWTDTSQHQYLFRWNFSYTDDWYISPKNNKDGLVPSYKSSDLLLSWTPSNSSLRYTLWSKNVFNEKYAVHAIGQIDFQYTLDGSALNMAPPRTLGVTANWTIQ